MSYVHVDNPHDAERLRDDLARSERIALDCEAAGFHRYANRLCLLQTTTANETYVVDPLVVNSADLFREVLERPDIPIVMHGADFDLRLLRADLDIRLHGLFDTQIAAAMLGEEALGLAALLESRLGVVLSKRYQRADWADRPLTDGMLEYAANDTRHLFRLADMLAAELEAAGRTAWAEQECLELERAADSPEGEPEPEDPVARVKGARDLSDRQVAALREALLWRDEIARARDRAPFRVIGDPPLVEAVARRPRRPEELLDIKGFPSALARSGGQELIRRLDGVAALSDGDVKGYPKPARRGPGRPPPEVEALADRLKAIRNRKAEELGLARGTLLANSVVLAIAVQAPSSLAELGEIPGMRPWRTELLGAEMLGALRGAD